LLHNAIGLILEAQLITSALLSVSRQVSAKFGTCTIVGLNGTLIEAKMFTFNLECRYKFHFQQLSHLDPRRYNFPNLALDEPNGLQCGIKITDDKSGYDLLSGVLL